MRSAGLLLLLFLLLLGYKVQANSDTLYISQDTTYSLTSALRYIPDNARRYSNQDILSGKANSLFKALPEFYKPAREEKQVLWLKVTVHNQNIHQITSFLYLPPYDSIQIYYPDVSGQYRTLTGGLLANAASKTFPAPKIRFPAQSTTVLYMWLEQDNFFRLVPPTATLAPLYPVMHTLIKEYLIFGITYGILLSVMIYCLVFYYFINDRLYLLLAFSLIATMLYFLFQNNLGAQFIWLTYPFTWINKVGGSWLFPPFQFISFSLFATAFLNTQIEFPRLHKLIWVLALLAALIPILFSFTGFGFQAIQAASYIGILWLLLIISLAILLAFKQSVPARFFVFSLFPAFITAILFLLYLSGHLPNNFFMAHIYQLGVALSSIMFAVAIGYKVRIIHAAQKEAEKQRLLVVEENERMVKDQNILLEQKVEERTADLIFAQQKLIQQEKLASLGELTAGIAHEIQNPLNFVNNFSEVSAELLQEMEAELQRGYTAEALALAADVKENLRKINQHGKRADSIVKNMLQHSRTSTGIKELTDLNALADEYLRLSYHGLRAKNKTFNAELVTDFAPDLGKIAVVPQDIGRVMLNLFNNAFYAVQQKAQLNRQYQPEVRVSTSCHDGKLEIKIRDNGTGMPEEVRSKIFQPFFTTKPTGQGTGLGLSLSYDIVAKGHGGEIQVESVVGEYTEFSVQLPALVASPV